jgi:uncharacterized SAM-binding protein YcdF (DUF218 family)
MFFLLSKLVALFLKPLTWAVALSLAALFTKPSRRKRRFARTALAVLVIGSNAGLITYLAGRWETGQLSPDSITQPYDYGIVLGGYIDSEAAGPADLVTLHKSGNRITAALELYHTGKIRRVLLTGGDGRLLGRVKAEAYTAREFLLEAGVPDSAIVVEPGSRNTRENALFTRALLDTIAPGASCLLITSAWHLPRAHACFQKAGLETVPFGADFMGERHNGNVLRWLEPNWEAWMKWDILLKEWAGFVVYRMRGYL